MSEVIGLFPTPFMRVPAALPAALISGLIQHFSTLAMRDNDSSANLSHTEMLSPGDSPLLVEVATLVTPHLTEFGALLFGERMGWSLKECGSTYWKRTVIRPCIITPIVLFRP